VKCTAAAMCSVVTAVNHTTSKGSDGNTRLKSDPPLKQHGVEDDCSSPMSMKQRSSSEPSTHYNSEESAGEEVERLEDVMYTTIMVQNLPLTWRRDQFVTFLKEFLVAGDFDFVYIPMNFRMGKNFGYAFVNLRDHPTAQKFQQSLEETEYTGKPSRRQGLETNIEDWRNNSVMHPKVPSQCKPVLYDDAGNIKDFPPPTKAIPKPRVHWKGQSEENDIRTAMIKKPNQEKRKRGKKEGAQAAGSYTSEPSSPIQPTAALEPPMRERLVDLIAQLIKEHCNKSA